MDKRKETTAMIVGILMFAGILVGGPLMFAHVLSLLQR